MVGFMVSYSLCWFAELQHFSLAVNLILEIHYDGRSLEFVSQVETHRGQWCMFTVSAWNTQIQVVIRDLLVIIKSEYVLSRE